MSHVMLTSRTPRAVGGASQLRGPPRKPRRRCVRFWMGQFLPGALLRKSDFALPWLSLRLCRSPPCHAAVREGGGCVRLGSMHEAQS